MLFPFVLRKNVQILSEIGQYLIPIASGSYALYKRDYAEALSLALCGAAQKAEVVFLKHLIPRQRPNGLDYQSFPSGHTAGAFLGVGFLASKYGLSSLTGLSFIGGILVALGRYLTKNHYPTDLLAGAAIGLLNGAFAGRKFICQPKLKFVEDLS